MEPITTAWMMSTLLGGWLGNRADFWLCQGVNKLYDRIKSNVNEPTNHHIQRAIRKSYLQATLMAVNHIIPQRKWYNLSDASWGNIKELESYLKEQIKLADDENINLRNSVLDASHREILFPKKGTSVNRMPELVNNLKECIIIELEGNRRKVELAVKTCIKDGWKEDSREMDFYKLTCAFFTQELKENTKLSTYIQTEYLDNIQTEIGEVKLTISKISQTINSFFEEYKDVLPLLREINYTLKEIKENLVSIPDKTALIVLQGIKDQSITPREITVSEEYQKYICDIQEHTTTILALNAQIKGVKVAMLRVDEETKSLLQQNIENLEKQLLQANYKKSKIENALNTFVSSVIQLAHKLKQTEEVTSARLHKARALFKAGKYYDLNKVLDEADIDEDIAQYEEKGKTLANELIIKAQTIVVTKEKGWFKEADRLYAKAMRIIENYDTTFNYALFLAEQKQTSKAIELYERALIFINSERQKGIVLNNIAGLLCDKNEFSEAYKKYIQALEIRQELATNNSHYFLNEVAETFNDLGVLQDDINNLDEAERHYLEALEIRREISSMYPNIYLPFVAKTLKNLGVLMAKRNKYEEAKKATLESINIFNPLVNENNKQYLPHLATGFSNLGVIMEYLDDISQAKKNYCKALEIRRELAKINPYSYLCVVADTLANLGAFSREIDDLSNSETYFQESIAIYRQLVTLNPKVYLPDLAMSLNEVGLLKRAKKEYVEAEQFFLEALKIYREFTQNDFNGYQLRLADTCLNLSLTYKNEIIDKEKSIHQAKEAKNVYSKYRDSIPHAEKWCKKAEEIIHYWNKNE